eukprot:scaffold101029_cov58-Phaeocystis_antarctica.AAC.2
MFVAHATVGHEATPTHARTQPTCKKPYLTQHTNGAPCAVYSHGMSSPSTHSLGPWGVSRARALRHTPSAHVTESSLELARLDLEPPRPGAIDVHHVAARVVARKVDAVLRASALGDSIHSEPLLELVESNLHVLHVLVQLDQLFVFETCKLGGDPSQRLLHLVLAAVVADRDLLFLLQRCAYLEQTEVRLEVRGRDDGTEELARLDARHHARLAALFPAHLVEPDIQWL